MTQRGARQLEPVGAVGALAPRLRHSYRPKDPIP